MLRYKAEVPTCLGSGKTSLPRKVHAWAHAVRLASSSWSDACPLLRSSTTWTSDLGTESLMWTFNQSALDVLGDWIVASDRGEDCGQPRRCNLEPDSGFVMQLEDTPARSEAAGNLFNMTEERDVQINSSEAPHYDHSARPDLSPWQTMSRAAPSALEINQRLDSGFAWDRNAYLFGRPDRAARDAEHSLRVEKAHAAITSDLFWAYCTLVGLLAEAVDGLASWSEGRMRHPTPARLEGVSRRGQQRQRPWNRRGTPVVLHCSHTRDQKCARTCTKPCWPVDS